MKIDRIGDVSVARMDVDYNALEEDRLGDAERELLGLSSNPATSRIVLDFSATRYLSSSLLEILFRVWSRMKDKKGKLAVCGLQPLCVEVMRVARLDTLWPMCKTVDDAIAATGER